MQVIEDSDQLEWLHSEEKLNLRAACLYVVFKRFGGQLDESGEPLHSPRHLYEACHDYLSHGNTDPEGVADFYLSIRESYDK